MKRRLKVVAAFIGFTFLYLHSDAFCPVGGVLLLFKTKCKEKITVFRVYFMFSGKEFLSLKNLPFSTLMFGFGFYSC